MLIDTERGPRRLWPDRITAVIAVPEMRSNTDANIVVDAIAYARIGSDNPRVTADKESRRLLAVYESTSICLKYIEHAIACAGYAANDVLPNLGADDAIPHGWTPVAL